MAKKLVRFDWAMKKMLRHTDSAIGYDRRRKANSAKGLKEANEKLDTMKLPEKERVAYDKYLLHLMSIASRNHTIEIEAEEIIKKAKEEEKIGSVLGLHSNHVPVEIIAKSLKISEEKVLEIIADQPNK